MKTLRMLFSKDPRIPAYLGIALILGVFLMVIGGPLSRRPQADIVSGPEFLQMPEPITDAQPSYYCHAYERAMERRLEEALSLVDGAGEVRVMVSFAQGRETVFAVDRNVNVTSTQEQDAQGGTRYQSSQQSQDNTLIIMDRPLVVKEPPPVIGGVMIIAEGGDDILVRDALIRATSTLLGVDINRVQVLKMRGE